MGTHKQMMSLRGRGLFVCMCGGKGPEATL